MVDHGVLHILVREQLNNIKQHIDHAQYVLSFQILTHAVKMWVLQRPTVPVLIFFRTPVDSG